MYELKNGILYKDGRAEFALGTSYFASFNKDKFPVEPGPGRFTEAVKDIADIANFGFNTVRVAAFEKAEPVEGGYDIDMPFINHMVSEIEKNGMASVVRLQGYTMNLKGRNDAVLCKADGSELNKSDVSVFIYDNFFNKELADDASEATRALADYFNKSSVVGYQIYNEPWLSGKPMSPLGYGKYAEEAYRDYLIAKGMSREEADSIRIPDKFCEENADEWIRYRLFVTEAFMNYLGDMNDGGKQESRHMESETNFTGCPTWHSCAHFSVNYFKAAKRLDYLGLDIYDPLKGGYFHFIKALMAMVESAAHLEGKHAQILEYCCRTHMSAEDFERQLSIAVATGFKGANFYAWRSDICGPEGGLGGMIFHDRKKTPKFDEAKKAVSVVSRLGNKIVSASRLRDGVAIFESEYARHLSDLTQHSALTNVNRTVYEDIYNEGFSPDYVDADHLMDNNLGIEILFVADYSLLSAEEKDIIGEFAKEHYVYRCELGAGYVMHDNCKGDVTNMSMLENFCWKPGVKPGMGIADWRFRISEVFELMGKAPKVTKTQRYVDIGCLSSNDGSYMLIALTNIHSLRQSIDSFDIHLDTSLGKFSKAVLYTKDGDVSCATEQNNGTTIKIPGIEVSGYLLLSKE